MSQGASEKTRSRGATFEDLEAQLFSEWCQVQGEVQTNGDFLRSRAIAIAKEMNLSDSKASFHWLHNFKKRHNVTTAKAHGTSRAADLGHMIQWSEENSEKLSSYVPDDILYADETGLFYRLLPDPALRGSRCHGGVQSKVRLTEINTTRYR